jgi:hypothetical protein
MTLAKVQVTLTRTVAQNNHQHGFLQISHMPCHLPLSPSKPSLALPVTTEAAHTFADYTGSNSSLFQVKTEKLFYCSNFICNVTLIKNVKCCDNIFRM